MTNVSSTTIRIARAMRPSAISPRFASAILLAILFSEFAVLLVLAGRKPLWYDELLTLHVSTLRPFSLLWGALRAGADGMPPAFYACILLARTLSGDLHVVLRLPSVIGYILSLLGVYWFARKRLPPVAGLSAVLLLCLSSFRGYATEARSYALVVGFMAISAVLWQRIDEKLWAKPLFAVSLTLAVAFHYLAVVALVGFSTAELTYFWISRRFRWSVWAGCLIATVPFLLSLPWLMYYHETFGKHFWSRPNWGTVFTTYGVLFEVNTKLALIGLSLFWLTLAGTLRRLRQNPQRAWSMGGFQVPEIILIGGFLVYPALLVMLAKVQNSGYTDRYGSPVVLALSLGAVFLTSKLWTKSTSIRVLFALLVAFLYQVEQEGNGLLHGFGTKPGQQWSKLAAVSLALPFIPVAIGTEQYLEAAYYAPQELRQRLTQVVDPEASVRLIGMDTTDKTVRLLSQFFPLRVQDSAAFLAAHQKFIVYEAESFGSWFLQYLVEKRYHLTVLWKDTTQTIFLAEE